MSKIVKQRYIPLTGAEPSHAIENFRIAAVLQLDTNTKYADVLERALYNGVLSGILWLLCCVNH